MTNRTTAKRRALVGAAMTLVGAGVVFLSLPIVELSIPIVAYLVLARILARSPHVEVVASRETEGGKMFEGGEVEVKITMLNQGGPVALLRAEDTIPTSARVARGSSVGYASLEEGGSAALSYSITTEAPGSWVLGPLTLIAEDQFGLTSSLATLQLPFRLDSLPRVAARPRFPFRPQRTKNWPGQVPSSRAGTGQEFYSIRPYLTSDAARSVNWKATARQDRMYTNQYMSELGAEGVIVVDKSYDSDFGESPASALDYVARCAAGVASGLLSEGNRVGLVVFGDRMYEVSPRTGPRQLERVLVALVRAEKGPAKTIGFLPDYLSLFFPRAAQVIVVSSLMNDDLVPPLLALGARRDVRVVTPSLTPTDPDMAGTETGNVATRLLRLQRWTTIERLRRRAVVSEWDVSKPVEDAIARALYPVRAVGAR